MKVGCHGGAADQVGKVRLGSLQKGEENVGDADIAQHAGGAEVGEGEIMESGVAKVVVVVVGKVALEEMDERGVVHAVGLGGREGASKLPKAIDRADADETPEKADGGGEETRARKAERMEVLLAQVMANNKGDFRQQEWIAMRSCVCIFWLLRLFAILPLEKGVMLHGEWTAGVGEAEGGNQRAHIFIVQKV